MEQVYVIEGLTRRLAALLLQEREALSVEAIALRLEVPQWAVARALESALIEGVATYAAGQGYWIAPHAPGVAQEALV